MEHVYFEAQVCSEIAILKEKYKKAEKKKIAFGGWRLCSFSKHCWHWRASNNVAKEGGKYAGLVDLFTPRCHSFCCYFRYFVHVTFASLQRIGRFLQICWNTDFTINLFGLRCLWSLLGHTSGILRLIFWWYLGDILTKYDKKTYQKCNFWKMSMSPNSRNVYFSETKAP